MKLMVDWYYRMKNRNRLSEKAKAILGKIMEWFFTGVVFAIVASILASYIMVRIDQRRRIQEQIGSLSNIYIGCNKEWADDRFGVPQFCGSADDYLLCAYVTDYYVIQMIFDEALSAQGYLITMLDNNDDVSWRVQDFTMQQDGRSEPVALGSISYEELSPIVYERMGNVSAGNARAFYAEYFFPGSHGNYYNYYFATLDFGKLNEGLEQFIQSFSLLPYGESAEEIQYHADEGMRFVVDRSKAKPNSYGVSAYDLDITDYLFSYQWFNSQQLRNRLNMYP